ncbi:hypothetical protein IG631_19906 [Alternaria alternata]|nr:hypothetical protein IG631_19906 [Alternaria alternata]
MSLPQPLRGVSSVVSAQSGECRFQRLSSIHVLESCPSKLLTRMYEHCCRMVWHMRGPRLLILAHLRSRHAPNSSEHKKVHSRLFGRFSLRSQLWDSKHRGFSKKSSSRTL